jgi:hypothetical protein
MRHTRALTVQRSHWLYPRAGAVKARGGNRTLEGAVAYREFVDDVGTMWRVWDTHPVAASTLRTVSPSYAGGWLTFESEGERRRLAPIPAEWEMATRDLMMHWCARALLARAPDRERHAGSAKRFEGGLGPDVRSPSSTR